MDTTERVPNTNLSVVTAAMLEYFGTIMWDATKKYVDTNIDTSALMTQIKEVLDRCNREVIEGNAREKANALLDSLNRITTVLENAGVDTSALKLSEYANIIRDMIANGYEVFILGKSGAHYSAEEWSDYIKEHGTEPEEAAVPAIITPYQSFRIGKPNNTTRAYENRQWGNTTDAVVGLYDAQTGSFVNALQNSLIFRGLENTKRMLLWYNPEFDAAHTIDYDPDLPEEAYFGMMCIRFNTHDDMVNSGHRLMYDEQVYVVKQDTDGTVNVCYYWNEESYVKRFVVPRVANNVTGSPAAQYAWSYHGWDGDGVQWFLPTINHLLLMYVYYTEINKVLSALDRGALPTNNSWACQQGSANNAYSVMIPSGTVTTGGNKAYQYAVVPVAAL